MHVRWSSAGRCLRAATVKGEAPPFKVVIGASRFLPHQGGVEELVRQLAHELQHQGRAVSVVTMRWPTDLPMHEVIEGIPVHRYVFRMPEGRGPRAVKAGALAPGALAEVTARMIKERPSLVHIQ